MKRLSSIYPLRSFGKCLHNEDTTLSKQDTLKNCKYSLSFESYELPFYMTEKIFDSLKSKTLTIYKGAPNVGDLIPLDDLPIINANGMTPEHVGQILHNLDADDEKYKKYFKRFEEFQNEKEKNIFLNHPKMKKLRKHAFDENICAICTAVSEMKLARGLFNNFLSEIQTKNERKFINVFPNKIPIFFGNEYQLKISEQQMKQFFELNSNKITETEKKMLMEIYDHAFGMYWKSDNEKSNWNDPNYFNKN